MAKTGTKSKSKSGAKSGAKTETGRPSKYQSDFAKKALKLCRLGATDPELANFFEVTVSTISKWKIDYPDFSEALKEGKDLADAEVANKLFKRATGYSHKAVKMFNHMGRIISTEYAEHYPPDTTACIFWLKNRQSAKWRDKPEGSTGNASVPELLREIADRLPD
jgi:hypothetical protein